MSTEHPLKLAQRQRTRDDLHRSRHRYLSAVAQHHARVAGIAVNMQKIDRLSETLSEDEQPHAVEMLERMAELIEDSHVSAFGTSMLEPAGFPLVPSPRTTDRAIGWHVDFQLLRNLRDAGETAAGCSVDLEAVEGVILRLAELGYLKIDHPTNESSRA